MLRASMDLAALLAARLEAERAAPSLEDVSGAERALLDALDPSSPPPATWIASAVGVIAAHQSAGAAERVWPLLRVIEPLLAELGERDPTSAGRIHGALAAQALLEIAPEAFLDRAARAAAAFDRAGDARRASVERAALGVAHAALGADGEAEQALRAALVIAAPEGLTRTAVLAGHHLARVLARRGSLDEARALAGAAAIGDDAARASFATILAHLGEGADAELEARDALAALDASPPQRALAAVALAHALLAQSKPREAVAALSDVEADASAIGWLAGGGAPVWIALADAHLSAGDATAAAGALAAARRHVLAAASKLRSPALRRSFLEGIPEHRRALDLGA
jgi:hypothetical protein